MPSTSLHVFGAVLILHFLLAGLVCVTQGTAGRGKAQAPFLPCHRAEAEAPVSRLGWAPWHVCWLLIFPQFSLGPNDLHGSVWELLPCLVWERQTCVSSRMQPGVFREEQDWCCVPGFGETGVDFAAITSLFKAQRFLALSILPELLSWHCPSALGQRLSQQMLLSLFGVDLCFLAAYWLRHMALG